MTRWGRVAIGCGGVVAIAASVAPAAAEGQTTVAAEALFVAARELLAEGRTAEACSKLEASHRLDPALGTMLHLADCHERVGRTASAWATFRAAASLAQASGQAARQAIAETRWRALEPRLSRVALQVPDEQRGSGLAVEVGGVAVPPASWALPLPVDPGDVEVRATAPGHLPWSTTVTVDAAATTIAVVVPALKPAPAPPEALAPPRVAPHVAPHVALPAPPRAALADEGIPWRTVGVITGGVGLVGLTLGSVFGVQAITKNDASLDRCRPGDPSLCSSGGVALRDEARSHATASTALFVAGTALLGAGVVLFVIDPGDQEGATVGQVTSTVAGDGAAVAIGGTL